MIKIKGLGEKGKKIKIEHHDKTEGKCEVVLNKTRSGNEVFFEYCQDTATATIKFSRTGKVMRVCGEHKMKYRGVRILQDDDAICECGEEECENE